jgi:hypothetical protein
MNILIPGHFEGYDSVTQTISELSAVGASTRPVWVLWGIVYTLLVAAFGWGILKSSGSNKRLRVVGGLMILYGIIGLGWPLAPMHSREVLAAGGGTISDTMHIAFSMVTVLIMLCAMGFGAAAFKKSFRLYSIVTILILVGFGYLTGMDAPRLQANLFTPWLGVWERIMIGVYLLWVIVLSLILLRVDRKFNNSWSLL